MCRLRQFSFASQTVVISMEISDATTNNRQLYARCMHCTGTKLREVKPIEGIPASSLHQCLTCFCVMPALWLQSDQADCPVCFCAIWDDLPSTLTAEKKAEYNEHRTVEAVSVCPQCNICVCIACTVGSCVVCKHSRLMTGWTCDTSPLDKISPLLRPLLADFALCTARKWPQRAHRLWPYMLEYVKWLDIIKNVPSDPNELYAPCETIDKLWRLHILCTMNYAEVCNILCCAFINHRFTSVNQHSRRKASVHAIRMIEPFTKHTAVIWGICGQSHTYSWPPTMCVVVRAPPSKIIMVPCRSDNTIMDVLIKADEDADGYSIWHDGRIVGLQGTLLSHGVQQGDSICLLPKTGTIS